MISPVEDSSLSRGYDKRYVMLNTTTEETVDDAQGYGFRSKKKAIRCWQFKNSPEGQAKIRRGKTVRRKNRIARANAIKEQKQLNRRISESKKKKMEEQ